MNGIENIPEKSEQEVFDELKQMAYEKTETSEDTLRIFQRRLQSEYTKEELDGTRLWHLLIGSTVEAEEMSQFDLPGGIIEHFIREEL